jgi:hypothetical protein
MARAPLIMADIIFYQHPTPRGSRNHFLFRCRSPEGAKYW